MTTLLLLVIYIAFIGLGIPDSLFGTAWPAIYTEFDLPISFASFVTVIISCGTIVSSMFSAKIINRFGTNKVSAFSTALTAVALLGFSISGSLWLLCAFAVPLWRCIIQQRTCASFIAFMESACQLVLILCHW